MKKTLIQCITAAICVIALALTSTSAIGKMAEAKIASAEAQAKNGGTAVSTSDGTAAPTDDGSYAPVDDGTSADVTPADDSTATATDAAPADDGSSTAAPSTSGDSSTAAPAGEKAGSSAPSSKADIIKYYNTAMNKVVSSKAGYKKVRHTDLTKLEGAEAIMKIKIAADAVNDFLGVGDKEYINKKGEAKFLSTAALTDADVKEAKCVPNGNIYTITLTLADGKSLANDSQKTDNSSLKRSGLFVGADDKSEYDYKSAVNIYMGLKNSEDTDIKSVDETTSKTTITIKVDSTTGNVQSLNASWHWEAALEKVKYTIISVSGTGIADSSVAITNFQY